MDFIIKNCPNCNGELHIPKNIQSCICMYCGRTFEVAENKEAAKKETEDPKEKEKVAEEYHKSIKSIDGLLKDHEIYVRYFTKNNYSSSFEKYVQEGRELLLPVEKYSALSEENKRKAVKETALALMNQIEKSIAEQTTGLKSTRRGEITYQYQFFLAVYTVPMIRYLEFQVSEELAKEIVDCWSLKNPKSTFQLADYNQLMSGFNRKGWCFITSAACEALEKEDDCYELTAFRDFRDQYMLETPERKKLVEEYYQIAPAIVAFIDTTPNSDKNYNSIWQKYLQPCLEDLENDRKDACQKRYTQMIHDLKRKYYINELF